MNALALIEALEAEGMAPEAIIRVLKGSEKKRDNTNAERQARHREKRKGRKSNARYGNAVTPNDNNTLTPEVSEAKASSPQPFVLPADIPADPWNGFEEMRRRIRKSMTDNARSLAVTELRRLRDEEGWPPGDVLNHCTMNSYQGIYPPTRKRNVSGIGKSAAAFAALNPSADEPF